MRWVCSGLLARAGVLAILPWEASCPIPRTTYTSNILSMIPLLYGHAQCHSGPSRRRLERNRVHLPISLMSSNLVEGRVVSHFWATGF